MPPQTGETLLERIGSIPNSWAPKNSWGHLVILVIFVAFQIWGWLSYLSAPLRFGVCYLTITSWKLSFGDPGDLGDPANPTEDEFP